MISQLGGTEIITSHIKNYFPNFNKNEFPVVLEENKNKIKFVLNNDKANIFISYKNLKNITKFYDSLNFVNISGILYYCEINIEVEKIDFEYFLLNFQRYVKLQQEVFYVKLDQEILNQIS